MTVPPRECQAVEMELTKVYRRDGDSAVIAVLAYLGHDNGGDDDEIRVVQRERGRLLVDEIAYHGPDGSRWLDDRHSNWTRAGYSLVSTEPGYLDMS
jgi:hypothetical protein